MDTTPHQEADARQVFPELSAPASEGPPLLDLGVLSELEVGVEVTLGSVELDLSRVARLRRGSLLRLECLTGEPLDILVNGTPIAKGEVRVHGERFAIRVTEIRKARRPDESPAEEVPRAEVRAP